MRLLFLLFIVILVFVSEGCSQVASTNQEKSNSLPKSQWLLTPFNPSVAELPPDFWGHSIIQLYNELSLKLNKKDDREESANYEKRIAESLKQPILGTIFINSTIALREELSSSQNLQLKYNENRQTLNIKINETDFVSSKNNKAILMVKINRIGVERFIEESARDIRNSETKIDNFQLRTVFVDLNNSTKLGKFFGEEGIEIKFSPEKVDEVEKHGSLLYVGSLSEPWVSRNKPEISQVKIDSSNSVSQKGQIFMKLTEIWLYNQITGEIYTKLKD